MRWLTLISTLLLTACVCVDTEVLETPQVRVVADVKNKNQSTSQGESINVTNQKNIFYY